MQKRQKNKCPISSISTIPHLFNSYKYYHTVLGSSYSTTELHPHVVVLIKYIKYTSPL